MVRLQIFPLNCSCLALNFFLLILQELLFVFAGLTGFALASTLPGLNALPAPNALGDTVVAFVPQHTAALGMVARWL